MAKKTYAENLLDPRWQKKRLEVLSNSGFVCEICGDEKSTLHVHHKHYMKGKEVWDYEINQLSCLCKYCHKNQHENEFNFNDLLSRIPLDGPGCKDHAYFLLAGFVGLEIELQHDYQKRLYELGDKASMCLEVPKCQHAT